MSFSEELDKILNAQNNMLPRPVKTPSGLIALQAEAAKHAEHALRLQKLQERVNSPGLARAIEFKAAQSQPLYFPEAPQFQVPQLEGFLNGDIVLGNMKIDNSSGSSMSIPVQIPSNNLLTHELILGRTKAGKTMELLMQYTQLLQLPRVSTIMIAIEGSELRILPSLPIRNVLILVCSERGNFRYNPLAPVQGATIAETVDDLMRTFASQWLGPNSMNILKPCLEQLATDIVNGKQKKFSDLVNLIKGFKQTELRDKVLGRIYQIDNAMYDTYTPLHMHLIAQNHVIIVIEQLNTHAATFFTNDFISKLMRWKRASRTHFTDAPRITAVLIDEAQRILPSAFLERDDLALIPLVSAVAQARKLGISLILSLQQPSLICDAFLANAGLILAGPINTEKDINAVRSALGMLPQQTAYYRTMPTKGFLVRMAGYQPFPITAPDVSLPEFEPDFNFINQWNQEVIIKKPELSQLIHKEPSRILPTISVSLQPMPDSDELIFLKAVNENPCHPVTDYYGIVGDKMAQQKANEIRQSLEKAEMLISHRIRTGGRGFQVGLEATEEALKKYSLKKKLVYWRGADYEHTYIAENVRRYFESRKLAVSREHPLGNHPADLFVAPDLAVEVAIGNKPEVEAQNIFADLIHANKALVIGNDKEHLKKIKKSLPKDALNRVSFKLFCEVCCGKQDRNKE